MVIYTEADMPPVQQEEEEIFLLEAFTSSNETSIRHFCDFVDFYTRHATNPMCTALTCQQQADAVRIAEEDLNPETVRMLIETMLSAIDHLEKKWLDEQLQREDVTQRSRKNLVRLSTKRLERRQKKNGMTHLWQIGRQWIAKRGARSKHLTQKELAA